MTKLDELIQELCPDGVKYKALGEICKLVTGATPSKTNAAYWENGTIPWMSSGEVNLKRVAATEKKITQLGYEKNSTTIVPKHSVVIALAGQGKTRGKAAITEIELCTNQSLCSMICNENLDYKFLYYILDGKYEELRAISNGDGTRGGLSLKILAPYKIPVPPLPVQREIVRILDNFTELTAELTARKKQYEFYRDELLFRNVNIPKMAIGTVCNPHYGKGNKIPQNGGDYPVYGCKGIVGNTDTFNSEDAPIVGHIGSAGSVTWGAGKHFVTYNGTICTPNKELVLSRYLYHILVSIKLENKVKGNQPFLSTSDFSGIEIPVPSLDVQERLVQVLDNFDAICTDLSSGLPAEIEARQKQYEYYRDKLLTFTPAD